MSKKRAIPRSRGEMRLAVLKVLAIEPLIQSHIMIKANLVYHALIEVLDGLVREELIEKRIATKTVQGVRRVRRTMFYITEKGIALIKELKHDG